MQIKVTSSHSQRLPLELIGAGPTPGDSDPLESGGVVAEKQNQELAPPSMYMVLMLNDDFTPMEFVVAVLQRFFSKDHEAAVQIMLMVHHQGKGPCGLYTRDVAATKVEQVLDAAKEAGHPLQCVMERQQ